MKISAIRGLFLKSQKAAIRFSIYRAVTANYLFQDFANLFNDVASNLPSKKYIPINYDYVNKIQASKGK